VGPMAFGDHTDWDWDERVLRTLRCAAASFRLLATPRNTAGPGRLRA
jgi:hypothetical protein